MKKIIIVLGAIAICVGIIFIKENINIKDDVYVVSYSEKEENNSITKNIPIIEQNSNKEEIISKKEITIYISGEVNNPGILTIHNDKRLYDAVKELGGTTKEADLNRINLAVKLEDEKHYIIPKIGDVIDIEFTDNVDTGSNNTEDKKVNINNATIEELDSLPGVGEATANKIIKYREENNKFNIIEEIKNVNGIGDKKYEEIKDLICIN